MYNHRRDPSRLPRSIRHDRSNLLLSDHNWRIYTLSPIQSRPTCIDHSSHSLSSATKFFSLEISIESRPSLNPTPPPSIPPPLFSETLCSLMKENGYSRMKRREETKIRYSWGAAEISQQPLDSGRHKVKGKTSTVINSTAPCILFKTVSSLTCAHRETSDLFVCNSIFQPIEEGGREESFLASFLSATKRKGLNLDFRERIHFPPS